MVNKMYVFLLFCCFTQCTLQKQKDTIEYKRSEIDIKTENIIDIIKDNENKDIYVFSNYLGTKEIKEGYYKGDYTGNFKQGAVFNDGRIFGFPENESYLFHIKDNIYSICPDFLQLVHKITVYKLHKDKLIKSSDSLSIPLNNSPYKLENSEFIIVSDEYELQGNSLKLYNKDLSLILTYYPYKEGFNNAVYTFINEKIYIVSTPSTEFPINKDFLITIIDSKNNFTIREKKITNEITPTRLVPFINKFLLIGIQKIALFDKDANLLWDKNLNIAGSSYSVTGSESVSKIFVISEGALVCLNLTDGAEQWRIPLQDLYATTANLQNKKNENYTAYIPIGLRMLKPINSIGVLTAKSEQFETGSKIRYSNKLLSIINYSGKIVDQIPISSKNKYSDYEEYSLNSKFRESKLLTDTSGFKIISNGKIEKFDFINH